MNNKIFRLLSLTLILFLTGLSRSFSQDHAAALAVADSVNFSINRGDGWKLFNSYATVYKKDSVQLEMILQHNNTVNWKVEQLVGKVKTASLIPQKEQMLVFNLMMTNYSLRVDTNGKCYLLLTSGPVPQEDPVIIPVRVFYKK
jgi:hypothetical protein